MTNTAINPTNQNTTAPQSPYQTDPNQTDLNQSNTGSYGGTGNSSVQPQEGVGGFQGQDGSQSGDDDAMINDRDGQGIADLNQGGYSQGNLDDGDLDDEDLEDDEMDETDIEDPDLEDEEMDEGIVGEQGLSGIDRTSSGTTRFGDIDDDDDDLGEDEIDEDPLTDVPNEIDTDFPDESPQRNIPQTDPQLPREMQA
jgi:hypothetical protein